MLNFKKIEGRDANCAYVTKPGAPFPTCNIPEMAEGMPVVKVHCFLGRKITNTPKLCVPRYVEEIEIQRERGNQNPIIIEISPENPHLMSDGNAVYTKDMSRLLFFFARDKELAEIPGSVREIAPKAFAEAHILKKVVIHEGVEEIGDRAFYFCESLEEAVLPKSLRKVGERAFHLCVRLERINLENVVDFGIAVFQDCTRLKNVELTCREVPAMLFEGCFGLEKLSMKNVQYIGDSAFDKFMPEKIVLPEGLRVIEGNAFGIPGKTFVLPGSLEKINGVLRAGTVVITLSENSKIFSRDEFVGKVDRGTLLEIRSPRNGETICRVMAYGKDILSYCDCRKKFGFDFEEYDKKPIENAYYFTLYNAILFRMDNPYEMSEEARARYEEYLNANAAKHVTRLIMGEKFEELSNFRCFGGISAEEFVGLIGFSAKFKRPELTALLLQKKSEFGKYSTGEDEDL